VQNGETAMLLGGPAGEAWVDVDVQLVDGVGAPVEVLQLTFDVDNEVYLEAAAGESVVLFVATDIAPGDVQLLVEGNATAWPVEGGEVINATSYVLTP